MKEESGTKAPLIDSAWLPEPTRFPASNSWLRGRSPFILRSAPLIALALLAVSMGVLAMAEHTPQWEYVAKIERVEIGSDVECIVLQLHELDAARLPAVPKSELKIRAAASTSPCEFRIRRIYHVGSSRDADWHIEGTVDTTTNFVSGSVCTLVVTYPSVSLLRAVMAGWGSREEVGP